jgi:hypothetical protein
MMYDEEFEKYLNDIREMVDFLGDVQRALDYIGSENPTFGSLDVYSSPSIESETSTVSEYDVHRLRFEKLYNEHT